MGQELELKYAAQDAASLDRILQDAALRAMMREPVREIEMRTTYFDTPDGALSARKWMLRRRMENGASVICCKTPLPGTNARGEWEVPGDDPAAALEQLVALGAPRQLLALCGLQPVCGAAFTRRAVLLGVSERDCFELACDLGSLFGAAERLPLCEVELELKSGSPEVMQRIADRLVSAYGLQPEAQSKAARARSLK